MFRVSSSIHRAAPAPPVRPSHASCTLSLSTAPYIRRRSRCTRIGYSGCGGARRHAAADRRRSQSRDVLTLHWVYHKRRQQRRPVVTEPVCPKSWQLVVFACGCRVHGSGADCTTSVRWRGSIKKEALRDSECVYVASVFTATQPVQSLPCHIIQCSSPWISLHPLSRSLLCLAWHNHT